MWVKAKEASKRKAKEDAEADRKKKGYATGAQPKPQPPAVPCVGAESSSSGVWPACLRIRSANCCFRQRFLRCCYSPLLLLPTGAGREIFLEEGFVAQDDLGASGGWQWGCLWLPV